MLFSLGFSAQVDLDNLSNEELYQYYLSEPEPIPFYKGPDTGDSLFYSLRPSTVPTETVNGDPLLWHRYVQEALYGKITPEDTALERFEIMKPKIALGAGAFSFVGDLGSKHFQIPQVSRFAFDMAISQRLTSYLQIDFSVLFGKLGASERLMNRQENFLSEIRAGGVNLLYDFGNVLPKTFHMRPFVSFGIMSFEYLSKTDLKDANGNTYYYWQDGSIKNMPENAAGAQNAIDLRRDYRYESDIRELNKDGFGKYQERAWAIPLGAGFMMKVTNRIDAKVNFQYFFTNTDYIDGISDKSIANRKGNKRMDNFAYTSVALQYDLVAKKKPKPLLVNDSVDNRFWLVEQKADSDHDGVADIFDACAGTPEGAKVNLKGCPLDDDWDGVPNYRDEELATIRGMAVNEKGVGLSDAYWQNWYNAYKNDTLDANASLVVISNFFDMAKAKKKKKKKVNPEEYTVEIKRYPEAIPSNELAFMLSIGDINSAMLEDGSTVVYTNGIYKNMSGLIKRRDEIRAEGHKDAKIAQMQGGKFIPVSDAELHELKKIEAGAGKEEMDEEDKTEMPTQAFTHEDVVYRVQLGAFKHKISTHVFNTSAGSVLEIKTGENIYRYVTKGYKTIEEAASVRADLVLQGYDDAFLTAYKDGKRIPLSQTKATVVREFKEDLSENKMFSSVKKDLVVFKIQFGSPKRKMFEESMDDKYKDVPDLQKETTATGNIRYSAGNFKTRDEANKFLKQMEKLGFNDVFVIAKFKDEIISLSEAQALLGN
jgi:hypothetical protein